MTENVTMNSDPTMSELTPESALTALRVACEAANVPADEAKLVRIGSNAVYRLPGNIVARVGRTSAGIDEARKQVAVSKWLSSVQYPAVRTVDVSQPIIADGRVVTFWESLSDKEEYAPIGDVARLIRDLHALQPPPDLVLPKLDPFGTQGEPLPDLPGLDSKDSDFLLERYEWARERFPRIEFALRAGPIHGDANVGNVLADRNGSSVLIDLDSFSTGPREWDLIQTAIFYDRFGWHSQVEYETFADVYGYDILDWSGYSELADIREISMTVWISRKAATSQRSAAEAAKRISAMRSGSSRADWAPY